MGLAAGFFDSPRYPQQIMPPSSVDRVGFRGQTPLGCERAGRLKEVGYRVGAVGRGFREFVSAKILHIRYLLPA